MLSLVSDATVPQLTLASTAGFNQVEYESNSDDSGNDVDTDQKNWLLVS